MSLTSAHNTLSVNEVDFWKHIYTIRKMGAFLFIGLFRVHNTKVLTANYFLNAFV